MKRTDDMNVKAKKALDQLGAMPGMFNVKEQVEQMIQFARISKLRESQGLKTKPHSNHMVFEGNPGTGKTTAARLIGKAFSELGLIQAPDSEYPPFIEVHHADVESELVGRAEKNIKEKFFKAEGGVIFIDEAYTFMGHSEHKSNEKIVATIVQLLEDMRDSVVAIIAGYPKEINEFLSYNPGLRSRFPTVIHFPDYNVNELMSIASYICQEQEYVMSPDFQQNLHRNLLRLIHMPGFSNARTVRNIIEQAIRHQSVRVSQIDNPGRQELLTLTGLDIKTQAIDIKLEKAVLMEKMKNMQIRLMEIDLQEITAKK